jgi:DNA invertase Pin-like site-specific DNA recombinase
MKIGYARVSTEYQNLNLQLDALYKFKCDQVFSDHLSGGDNERPGLKDCLNSLKSGDSLVVWKLDRLGRSLVHLVSTVESLRKNGIEFVSLTESMDTNTATGRLVFHVFAALAEFVRSTTQERVMAGLAAARLRGRTGGRPKSLKGKTLEMFTSLAKDPTNKPEDICKLTNISIATFYRYKARVSL